MRRTARHRGSVYIATLGAAMLVTILGVSALMAVRVQRDAASLDRDADQAALAARSAVEIALRTVQNSSNWRSAYQHDTWTADTAHGRVRYAFKFASTAGNSLTGFANDPARVYGRGAVGDAVRIESVLLRPIDLRGNTPGVNMLVNPSFTGDTSGWGIIGGVVNAVLDLLTTRTAPGALTISGRSSPNDGASQDLTSKLVNGMTYDTSVWARSQLLTTDNARIRIYTRSTGSGEQTFSTGANSINSLLWRQVTGTLTPAWQGHLLEARWEVVTTSNSYNFTIDDASLAISTSSPRPHTIDPSSWRRELP